MPAINGSRVRQAREIQAWTQADLAEKLSIYQPDLSLIEQGAKDTPEKLIHSIALATGFPTAFFHRPNGPDFPLGSLLYRKRRKLPSATEKQIRQSARLALELLQELGESYKALPIRIPLVGSGNPVEAAQVARSVLGASPDGPIARIVRRMETAGVFVFFLPTDAKGFDAFSAWSSEAKRRPVVCLRHGVPGDRLRFTLGEELGHLMMHQDFLGSPRELDQEAREFAGEFLFPSEEMRDSLRLPITLTHLADLKAQWGVSMLAILYLAQQRDLITERQKRYAIAKMRNRGWLREEPVHIPVETPRLWRQLAEETFGVPVDHRRLASQYEVSPVFVQSLLETNRPADPKKISASGTASVLRFRPTQTN